MIRPPSAPFAIGGGAAELAQAAAIVCYCPLRSSRGRWAAQAALMCLLVSHQDDSNQRSALTCTTCGLWVSRSIMQGRTEADRARVYASFAPRRAESDRPLLGNSKQHREQLSSQNSSILRNGSPEIAWETTGLRRICSFVRSFYEYISDMPVLRRAELALPRCAAAAGIAAAGAGAAAAGAGAAAAAAGAAAASPAVRLCAAEPMDAAELAGKLSTRSSCGNSWHPMS